MNSDRIASYKGIKWIQYSPRVRDFMNCSKVVSLQLEKKTQRTHAID